MNNKEYLPIGSIIKLNGFLNKFIIVGYGKKSKNILYDYAAFPYPQCYLKKSKFIVFNKDKISEILFEGFKVNGYERINEIITDAIVMARSQEKTDEVTLNEQ